MKALKNLSLHISKLSNGWVTLAGLLIFLLFTTLVLPGQSRKAEQISGGAGSPDTSFYYSPSELYRMAEMYGAAGRQEYVQARFTFDLVFPLVYTFFLVTSISWLFAKVFSADSRWQLANLIPLVSMLFDYLENIAASIVMLRYPTTSGLVVSLAPIFTLLKWSFIGVSFALLVIGFLAGLWKWAAKSRLPRG